MTKEELEKEAEEWLCNNLHSASEEDFIKAMVDIAEPREKRIAELEKRCANYEMTISKMEKGTCDICKETEKDKKIEELEKENAELKKQLEMSNKVYNNNLDYSYHIEGQLTKAKCILADFLKANTILELLNVNAEAENFLKESEVEK